MAGVFTVQAVELGRRVAETSAFVYLTDPGVPIDIAYRLWVLKSAAQTIVVDTGPPVEESRRRDLKNVIDASSALSELGIDAAAIDTVILTHLHWDHAANADQFPNARFIVQEKEIDFFYSRIRKYSVLDRFFDKNEYIDQLIQAGRMNTVNGSVEIAQGVRVLCVGGHTAGLQIVCVATPDGEAVIAGDAIPLQRNYSSMTPPGIVVDVREAIVALEDIAALRPSLIYTGHDPATFFVPD